MNERDLTLLRYMGIGLTTKQIADRMGISPKTVEYHINGGENKSSLAAKLHVSDRGQMIRMAVERGLVKPGEKLTGDKLPGEKPKVKPAAVNVEGIEDLKKALLSGASRAASAECDPIQVTALCQCSDAYIRVVRLQMEARFAAVDS